MPVSACLMIRTCQKSSQLVKGKDSQILLYLVDEMRTLYFEKKYGVNIKDFKSTTEIDQVIEKSLGRSLKLTRRENPLVNHGGCVFKLREYNVEEYLNRKFR